MRSARRASTAVGVAVAITAVLAAAPGSAASEPPAPRTAGVEVEIPGPEGGTSAGSGHTYVPAEGQNRSASRLTSTEVAADGEVAKMVDNGSTADRLDIVVVGDGYTASELPRFHADAQKKWEELTAVEPYTTYRNLFNVWTVDAVSNESGVSGDPSPDTVRDTALGSYFWCDQIERLLCVDQRKVDGYVAKAPEADLVLVLSNSTKYGGAGYNERSETLGYEGISTASAGNEKSGQVAIHETGHSLGKLADEYFYADYPGYEHYQGPEPADSNISTLTADDMASRGAKWHRWLGEQSPDGGIVGAYEGGGYYVTGLRRPTENSLMRSLGKPFNLPGVEAMIAGFYREARIASPVTSTDRTLRTGDTAKALVPRLAGPDGRQLTIRWYLDGRELKPLAGRTQVRVSDLTPRLRDLRKHTLSLTAEDHTPSVRDRGIARTMKSTVSWTIRL
ncbi:M64 family metallopeptidase [Streptomyces sp. NPDC048330]|uniref:M64 family metallopeptidase n=1 Tax=Streptomyces sp. NPDC048330 TaxID=3365533 RepID=UPI00371D613C